MLDSCFIILSTDRGNQIQDLCLMVLRFCGEKGFLILLDGR